jgi:DNA-binding response OmpR family regulator
MKVLFMSGYTGGFATQIGLLGAGAKVLQKPFSRDALLRKLREVLEVTAVAESN